MISRRLFLAGSCATLARPREAPAAAPDMLSSGYIVRRRGSVRHHVEGLALTSRGRQRFTLRHPFRVASVSKLISAFGFMTLQMRGAIDLDADVSGALGWRLRHPAYPDAPITARMLLSHTSGLRNGADFPIPFNSSLRDRLSAAATEPNFAGWFSPPSEAPGQWFAYSDANFALVAQLVERLTGARFDHFMRDTVFAPDRLDIGYNWSGVSANKRVRAAAGCRWVDGVWTPQVDARAPPAPEIALYRAGGDNSSTIEDYHIGENGFAFAPHGGLRLSLTDMDVLARRLANAPQTSAQSAPAWVFTPEAPNGATENGFFQAYGLGAHIPAGRDSDSYFGAESSQWRGHFGDAYGWMTGLWWNRREQISLVYAINGMPEVSRRQSIRTALTAAEQDLIDRALAHVGF